MKKRIVARLGWPPEKLKELKFCKLNGSQAEYFKDGPNPIQRGGLSNTTNTLMQTINHGDWLGETQVRVISG